MIKLKKREKKVNRSKGLTSIIDTGLSLQYIESYLELNHEYIDYAKIGWGSCLITNKLDYKIKLYQEYNVDVYLGGTFLEYCYHHNQINDGIDYITSLNLKYVEISDGCINFNKNEKNELIQKLSKDFYVFSEVGSKDNDVIVSPYKWVEQIHNEISSGAKKIILEGRESGTGGMYRDSGEIRMGLIDEIIESGINIDQLIFEAPKKNQQVWFIKKYGINSNFGNIHMQDVISLESLRLGIRADTLIL